MIRKRIPSTGESLAVIGMGTWLTFDVGDNPQLLVKRTEVLRAFLAQGGQLIDSSPMYGSSQKVIGNSLRDIKSSPALFSADKVWTSDGSLTHAQSRRSADKWGIDRFDLLQVHNLLNWENHFAHLSEMQQQGDVRYIGVTTSHGLRHAELEKIVRRQAVDFIQLSYNLDDREAERRLLPLASERGIAVIANRPFKGGQLIDRLQSGAVSLPAWAHEFSCSNWPSLLLKFVVSHPAVTCAIPATTQVTHMRENMLAARGPLLDTTHRKALTAYMANI